MESKCVVCKTNLTGKQKKFCSNSCKCSYHYTNNKEQLNGNTYYRQTIKHLYRKIKLLERRSNSCEKCGYDQNIAALDFHHLDSSYKTFPLDARHLSNKKWKDILKEFEKCKILCSNCHREEHNPESQLKIIKEKYIRLANDIGLRD